MSMGRHLRLRPIGCFPGWRRMPVEPPVPVEAAGLHKSINQIFPRTAPFVQAPTARNK